MLINFGKYSGKTTEWVIINAPDYALWILDTMKPGSIIHSETSDLIREFDHRPFTKKCAIQHCKKRAMESYVYSDSLNLYYWCRDCADSQSRSGPFIQLPHYRQTVNYITNLYGSRGNKTGITRQFILRLAYAKGLPEGGGKKQLRAFFGIKKSASPYARE